MPRHDYTWRSAWSVSRILQARWPMPDEIPQSVLERGSRIHEWTENYDTGTSMVPPAPYEGWCEAYKRFSYTMSPSWTDVESPVETDQYHGILDRAGFMRGKQVVADIKTGPPRESDRLQLAAYALAMYPKRYQSIVRVGVYITKDGEWKIQTHDKLVDYVDWNTLVREVVG
jgi:hypothetical protein